MREYLRHGSGWILESHILKAKSNLFLPAYLDELHKKHDIKAHKLLSLACEWWVVSRNQALSAVRYHQSTMQDDDHIDPTLPGIWPIKKSRRCGRQLWHSIFPGRAGG